MDFIRWLKRENVYFSSQSFQIWWQISGIEVRKTQNFSSISQKRMSREKTFEKVQKLKQGSGEVLKFQMNSTPKILCFFRNQSTQGILFVTQMFDFKN